MLAVTAVVVIAVLVLQATGAGRGGHNLALPAKVGALPLIGVAATAAQQSLTAEGWSGVAGAAYGSGQGQLLLVVGRPPDPNADTATLVNGLQTPLVQQGFVFNASTANTTTISGTSYICGPASAPGGQLTLCVWDDGDAAGIVVDYSGATQSQVRQLASTARVAAEH